MNAHRGNPLRQRHTNRQQRVKLVKVWEHHNMQVFVSS